MRGVPALCACAVILGSPPAARASESPGSRHRGFWDAALGTVLSDNVYLDRSQEAAAGYDVSLQAGLRSRYSPRTFSQLLYELDAGGFRRANVENRLDHGLRGLVRHRIREALTLEVQAGVRLSRFPKVAVFDNRTYFGQAGLRTYLAARTTLEAGVDLEAKSYPDFDLDYEALGLFTTLGQELGRRTYAELSGVVRRSGYSERRVLDPLDPAQTEGELRDEASWLAAARLVRDLSAELRLELGYQLGRVDANGDFLDFGPFQSRYLNEVAGDERVVGDYYSHRRHDVSVRLRKLIRRGLYVVLGARYQARAYDGRLAKDEQEQFLSPEELRRDRRFLLSATVDLPFPGLTSRARRWHPGLRVQLLHEVHRSNDALYDYDRNALAASITSWF